MTLPFQVSSLDSKPTETRYLLEPKPSLRLMEQHQKKTPDPRSSQVTTVMQTSSDRFNSSPDKVSSSMTQLPQTISIVEEVPLCTLRPQSQLQLYTMDFGENDIEDLFNGFDGEQDMTGDGLDSINQIPTTSLMDPVLSEMLTTREPVRGQPNITVTPVSLDTA